MSDSQAMSISIDDEQVVAMLNKAPDAIKRRVGQSIEGAAIDVQAEMRIQANVGATGDLRRSVRYTFSLSKLSAEVSPNVPYSVDVESGTKPHAVSAAPGTPLARWAKIKGLNPYAVANAIRRRGTKAHPFIKPTHEKMKPKVENDITSAVSSIVEEINNGRI